MIVLVSTACVAVPFVGDPLAATHPCVFVGVVGCGVILLLEIVLKIRGLYHI